MLVNNEYNYDDNDYDKLWFKAASKYGLSFVKRVDGMSLAMFFGFDGFFNVPSAMHNFD